MRHWHNFNGGSWPRQKIYKWFLSVKWLRTAFTRSPYKIVYIYICNPLPLLCRFVGVEVSWGSLVLSSRVPLTAFVLFVFWVADKLWAETAVPLDGPGSCSLWAMLWRRQEAALLRHSQLSNQSCIGRSNASFQPTQLHIQLSTLFQYQCTKG